MGCEHCGSQNLPFLRDIITGQRIEPPQVNTMSKTNMFEVEIADASGHSTVLMSKNEIAEKATQTQGSWVFVNDQLVSSGDIAEMNLEAGSRIRLMPGLVGGLAC